MVVGKLLYFSASQSVRARVTNTRNHGSRATEQHSHTSAAGSMLIIFGPGQCVHGAPSSLYNASQKARRGAIRRRGIEQAPQHLDGRRTRHAAAIMTSHAITNHEQSAACGSACDKCIFIDRLGRV